MAWLPRRLALSRDPGAETLDATGDGRPPAPRATSRGLAVAGTTCLVTGASGGIGAATARRLARSGARLVLHGRDRAMLNLVAEETSGVPVVGDLTAPGAIEAVVAEAEERLGPLDVVVSTAGAGWAGHFVEMEPERIQEVLTLNLHAPVQLARVVLPGMVARGRGHLVLVGSIAGHLGVRQEAVYSAAKSGLAGLAAALNDEVASAGVGVSLVSPGVVATAFFERRGRPYDRALPRPIHADRVAAAVEQAVTEGRSRVIVPAWMELPVALATLAPSLYRRLATRFG